MLAIVVERLRQPPRLKSLDVLFTLLPAGLWALAVHSRDQVIKPRCAEAPHLCQPENVFFPDQLTLGMQNRRADELSFLTQDWAAYLAILTPVVVALVRMLKHRSRARSKQSLFAAGADLAILLQTVAWNGLATELLRLTVQRPRPFVYDDPARLGELAAHYTSFVSGHTSFVAATGAAMTLTLLGRSVPGGWVILAAITATGLTFLTGMFRVMAGRHFPSDVVAAMFSGFVIAVCVAYFHRPRSRVAAA